MAEKSRKQILKELKMAEMEEGRSGLVDIFLKENPEKKPEKKDKK